MYCTEFHSLYGGVGRCRLVTRLDRAGGEPARLVVWPPTQLQPGQQEQQDQLDLLAGHQLNLHCPVQVVSQV